MGKTMKTKGLVLTGFLCFLCGSLQVPLAETVNQNGDRNLLEQNARKSLKEAIMGRKKSESQVNPTSLKQISVKAGTKLCQSERNPHQTKGITYYVVENIKDNLRYKIDYHVLTNERDEKVFTFFATINRSEIEDDRLDMLIDRAFAIEGDQVKELPLVILVQSGLLFPGVHQAVKICPDIYKLLAKVEADRKAIKDAEQEEEAIERARNEQYSASSDEVFTIDNDLSEKSRMSCERELTYMNPTKPVLRPKNQDECEALKREAEEFAKNLRSKYPFVDFEVTNDSDRVGIEAMNQNR
jgi:hypothetical protein